MQKLIVGAALLDDLSKPTRLLVARRTAPAALAGLWEFPGGKVEPGEEAEQGLLRELVEELGIEAVLGAELPVRAAALKGLPIAADAALGSAAEGWPLSGGAVMRLWLAAIADGVPTPLEDHDELRWMPLSDPELIMALPWIPADFPIVAELLRVLG
ncbi:NUDIX domain-containing protein [Psychromicrobium silvestre]|nr:NUDIX domain-containing protein [Psychromicrobium silvestre]